MQQAGNGNSNTLDQLIPIVHAQSRRRNRLANSDADMHWTDDGTPLPHSSAAALHRYGDDRHLRLNGHDETSLLEGEELAGAAACPFWKDEEGIARPQRFGAPLD